MGYAEEVILSEAALTAGHIKMKGYTFAITAAAGEQSFDVSLPFDVDALSAHLAVVGPEDGDKISIIVAPDTAVGLIDNAGGYAIGAKVLTVDASVVANTWVGMLVRFGAATEYYWITARDTENNTITIWPKDGTDDGLAVAVNDDDPVKISVCMADGVHIHTADWVHVGESKVGGSGIAATKVVRMIFDNTSATAKTLKMNVELLYGDV